VERICTSVRRMCLYARDPSGLKSLRMTSMWDWFKLSRYAFTGEVQTLTERPEAQHWEGLPA
jgi:hypothetical protein